jgi:hypothetical protein
MAGYLKIPREEECEWETTQKNIDTDFINFACTYSEASTTFDKIYI